MMDWRAPTRAARHGLLFTSEGKVSIKQAGTRRMRSALDPPANAASASVIRGLPAPSLRSNELLAQVLNTVHNLHFYLATMRTVGSGYGRAVRTRANQGCSGHGQLPNCARLGRARAPVPRVENPPYAGLPS